MSARQTLRVRDSGFTLAEILIAVIVLGLGLLGLAALFPVVIREQRIGTDNVLSVTVSNSARATLRAARWQGSAADFDPDPANAGFNLASVWALLGQSTDGLAEGGTGPSLDGTGQRYELGEWFTPAISSGGTWPAGTTIVGDPGDMDAQGGIALASRLYPAATADQGAAPLMVWDFAVQRISDFDFSTGPFSDRLRLAVFIRRLDPRIRVAPGYTLRQVLTDPSVPAADRRLPVGEDSTGLPTLDGTDGSGGSMYAGLKIADFETDFFVEVGAGGEGVALTEVNTGDAIGRLLAQPGQKLVDNLGNVYTVNRVEAQALANADIVRCELVPAIPASALRTARNGQNRDGRKRLQQLLFSAQIPAGVVLQEIEP